MPLWQKLLHTLVALFLIVNLRWFMKEENVRKWLSWQIAPEFVVQMNIALGKLFGPIGIIGAVIYIIVIWVNNGWVW